MGRKRKMFKGQKFERCSTHTNVDKEKFKIGSIWFDRASGQFGRVVGYPLNDYYYDAYVGMCYFDASGRYVGYGASRSDKLRATNEFPFGFRPKGERED